MSATSDYAGSYRDAAALGTFTGAVIGIVAGFCPVFHWEMAGPFVLAFAGAGGLVAGALASRRGFVLGGLGGSITFGVLFLVISMTASLPRDDPWGIPIWGTVTVVVASFAAAIIVRLYSRTKHALSEKRLVVIGRAITAFVVLVVTAFIVLMVLVIIVSFLMKQLG